jgi:hypothetical protein
VRLLFARIEKRLANVSERELHRGKRISVAYFKILAEQTELVNRSPARKK